MEAALLVLTGLPLVHQYSTTVGFLHSFSPAGPGHVEL